MKIDFDAISIFIRPGSTDMRKQANGLSIIVVELMKENPGSGNLFIFCNRERKLIKCLWWDRNGFWLAQKRLEKGRWPWPNTKQEVHRITKEQLMMMISGIDFWKAHEIIEYKYY